MAVLFSNNARAIVASALSSSATTVTVETGQGALFPAPTGGDWFPLVLQRSADYTQIEITRCTSRSGDALTITRAQEGTTGITFAAGDTAELRITEDALTTQFATAAQGALADNAEPKQSGKSLSANDFTDLLETKLGNIEANATADQTASEIKSAYESNTNTNAFTDAQVTKLSGIEASATADQTAAQIKTAYESNANTNAYNDAAVSKLAGIEASATADQTAGEIKTAYESNSNTNVFTDAKESKLSGIEANAEVNTVDSVAGKTGAVSLVKGDVGLGSVRNVSSYSQTESDAEYIAKNGGGIITKNTSAGVVYSNGHLELVTSDGSDVSVGFHRGGYTACQLRHESNGLILSGTSRTSSSDLVVTGNITAYSDSRLKENLDPIDGALELIGQLTGYRYTRTESTRRETGLIAQEVLAVLPEAVMGGPNEKNPGGMYSLAYGNLAGLFVQAIKEQQAQIETQRQQIEQLTERMAGL